jgi:hypothetical protein
MPPRVRAFVSLLCISLAAAACGPSAGGGSAGESAEGDGQTAAAPASDGVVEIVAADYAFSGPSEVPSGWTTFRFVNQGMEPHFFVLDHLPEGKTFDDFVKAGAAFDTVMIARRNGMSKADAAAMLGDMLPAWFGGVEQTGGVGLVMPGDTTVSTVKLVPGNYVMECYVKNAEGKFHASLGMGRPFTVTTETSATEPPTADLEITMRADGMDAPTSVAAGEHTVAVHFVSQPEVGIANDVNVVKIGPDTDLAALDRWMDWLEVGGLESPAPAEFLGGTQEMPAGNTSYFTVRLDPGQYAWITEGAAGRGMMQKFTVE